MIRVTGKWQGNENVKCVSLTPLTHHQLWRVRWPIRMVHDTLTPFPDRLMIRQQYGGKVKRNSETSRPYATRLTSLVHGVWLSFYFSFYSDFYEPNSHYRALRNFTLKTLESIQQTTNKVNIRTNRKLCVFVFPRNRSTRCFNRLRKLQRLLSFRLTLRLMLKLFT